MLSSALIKSLSWVITITEHLSARKVCITFAADASSKSAVGSSAINNFGVREILNTLVELAPSPGGRKALQREVRAHRVPTGTLIGALIYYSKTFLKKKICF